MNNSAYIALGSNIGNRLGYLQRAIDLIDENENNELAALSSVYESRAFGIKDQADFLNAAALVKTSMQVKDFFSFLKEIEKKVGRSKSKRWGPREIDLDLLFYNNLILNEYDLSVPHPEIQYRDFVIVPLSEIAPGLIHPVLNIKIGSIIISPEQRTIKSVYWNHLQINSGVL